MIFQRLYSSVTQFRNAISLVAQLSPVSLSLSIAGIAQHFGITKLHPWMKETAGLYLNFSFPSAHGFTHSISLTDNCTHVITAGSAQVFVAVAGVPRPNSPCCAVRSRAL